MSFIFVHFGVTAYSLLLEYAEKVRNLRLKGNRVGGIK